MFPCFLLCNILVAAPLEPTQAKADWTAAPVSIHLKDQGYLFGFDGHHIMFVQTPGPRQLWQFKRTEKGYLIQLKQVGNSWDGFFLAYDPEGKKPDIFLAKDLGPGTYWKVTPQKMEKDKSTGFQANLQATADKVKDWHLSSGRKKIAHVETVLREQITRSACDVILLKEKRDGLATFRIHRNGRK